MMKWIFGVAAESFQVQPVSFRKKHTTLTWIQFKNHGLCVQNKHQIQHRPACVDWIFLINSTCSKVQFQIWAPKKLSNLSTKKLPLPSWTACSKYWRQHSRQKTSGASTEMKGTFWAHGPNPIASMCGIFTYIYHKNQPFMYTIHGWYGNWRTFVLDVISGCQSGRYEIYESRIQISSNSDENMEYELRWYYIGGFQFSSELGF